jgi:large subunit ribosomal protein L3
LLGRKVGMMRIFTDDGDAIPVTVLDVSNNRVTQVKTGETDGYNACRSRSARARRPASPSPKPGTSPRPVSRRRGPEGIPRHRRRRRPVQGRCHRAGGLFAAGQKVDVQGTSIGKGFAGTIKRHNFSSQRASHGNSRSHNVPGSISMAQDPGRVFPGKKMTGHMGDETVTTQNLDVVACRRSPFSCCWCGRRAGLQERPRGRAPAVKAKLQEGSQLMQLELLNEQGQATVQGRRA